MDLQLTPTFVACGLGRGLVVELDHESTHLTLKASLDGEQCEALIMALCAVRQALREKQHGYALPR